MAILNFLQSKFTGRLGETTGANWKGKSTIRAAIFSKAPPTDLQTANVRAFESLNRLSSAIARLSFKHTGLSANGLHEHNAVASWLKPIIRDHTFNPSRAVEVIPLKNFMQINAFTFNRSTGELFISIRRTSFFPVLNESQLYVLVINDLGQAAFSFFGSSENFQTRIFLDTFQPPVYTLFAFVSVKRREKWLPENFLYKRGTGMRYSLDEQLTGDLWIDGRPIYQRTYRFQIIADETTTNFSLSLPMGTPIYLCKAECASQMPYSIPYMFAGQAFNIFHTISNMNPTFFEVMLRADTNHLNFSIYTLNGVPITYLHRHWFYCTIFYIKQFDQPVVDGLTDFASYEASQEVN